MDQKRKIFNKKVFLSVFVSNPLDPEMKVRSGQDVPINAISSKTKRLIREVLDSDNQMMGYILRVTHLKKSIPHFERNQSTGRGLMRGFFEDISFSRTNYNGT